MGVLSLQLCFSKAHGDSRTHRICPGGVTSAQRGILGGLSLPCSLAATARGTGDAPGASALKFLSSLPSTLHTPVLHSCQARAGGSCLQEELWQWAGLGVTCLQQLLHLVVPLASFQH